MAVSQEPEQRARWVNVLRRGIGAAVCLAPVALLLASFGVGLASPRESGVGVGLSVAGLLVGGINLYIAIIRPALYAWRHSSTAGLKNVSVAPLFGNLLVVAGGIVGFGDWRSAAVGLAALALDFGGLPWFLVMTWRDRSFWDE
jgi:hypothetical protein